MKRIKKQFSPLGNAIEHFQNMEAISTYRIAALTGLTESTLSKLKYGKTTPSLTTLERVAKVLNVKVSDIILHYEQLCDEAREKQSTK
jgi:transcriptional regulator with XRE-family HTH domain